MFFEGNAEEMHGILYRRLTAVPDSALMFPGHEYALPNLLFSVWVEPSNEAAQEKVCTRLHMRDGVWVTCVAAAALGPGAARCEAARHSVHAAGRAALQSLPAHRGGPAGAHAGAPAPAPPPAPAPATCSFALPPARRGSSGPRGDHGGIAKAQNRQASFTRHGGKGALSAQHGPSRMHCPAKQAFNKLFGSAPTLPTHTRAGRASRLATTRQRVSACAERSAHGPTKQSHTRGCAQVRATFSSPSDESPCSRRR